MSVCAKLSVCVLKAGVSWLKLFVDYLSPFLPLYHLQLSLSLLFADIVHDMNRSGSVPRSEMSGSRGGEPNLNDVVDFLSSDNPSLVSNAASYLQHLAYGDDSMKSKIR